MQISATLSRFSDFRLIHLAFSWSMIARTPRVDAHFSIPHVVPTQKKRKLTYANYWISRDALRTPRIPDRRIEGSAVKLGSG